MIQMLTPYMDAWYIAEVAHARGASAEQLRGCVAAQATSSPVFIYADVRSAYRQACNDAGENDRIIVFGSFFTVADTMCELAASLPAGHT